jgi:hypothetical protein
MTGWLLFAACYAFAATVLALWVGRWPRRHDGEYREPDERGRR